MILEHQFAFSKTEIVNRKCINTNKNATTYFTFRTVAICMLDVFYFGALFPESVEVNGWILIFRFHHACYCCGSRPRSNTRGLPRLSLFPH